MLLSRSDKLVAVDDLCWRKRLGTRHGALGSHSVPLVSILEPADTNVLHPASLLSTLYPPPLLQYYLANKGDEASATMLLSSASKETTATKGGRVSSIEVGTLPLACQIMKRW